MANGRITTTGVIMKKIEAIIKPFKLDEVKDSLNALASRE